MPEKLISGDNHIDLTYLPPDLWSSEVPTKWKLLAPRRGDGGRPPLVRRGSRQGDVERYRPGVYAVSERDVRPYRRDEGSRLRMELQPRRQTAADNAGAASR